MAVGWLGIVGVVSGLVVETGSPDALCPDLESTEQAISGRLGELRVSDGNGWRVRYSIVHAPDDAKRDFVRLELYDTDDQLRLSRELAFSGETCSTMAQVIALVVDRFFRALNDGSGAEPAPRTESSPGAEPSQPANPASQTRAATAGAGESPRQARMPHPSSADAPVHAPSHAGPPLLLSVELGFLSSRSSPTAGLELAAPVIDRVSLAVGAAWVVLAARESLARGGEAELYSGLVRFDPAWNFAIAGARLGLGPTFSLELERASTSGLAASHPKYRVVAAAGAGVSADVALERRLVLGFSSGIELPFLPFGGRFVVDGEEALEPAGARVFLEAGLGFAFSP